MAELTDPQIDTLRYFIRDKYATSPSLEALSEFNRSRQDVFFSDGNLREIDALVAVDKAEELATIHTEKYDERIAEGDSAADATIAADAIELECRFRLIRIRCREQMMEDPGFRASLTVGEGTAGLAALFKVWEARNRADDQWVRSRSGVYGSVELERL